MSTSTEGTIATRVKAETTRPLSAAERYVLDASSEVAFTRQRREIALSEAEAARAELVGIEFRALALALESRRARMPRTLSANAQHGDLRQTADGTAGANLTGQPLRIGDAHPFDPPAGVGLPRPRMEMAAPLPASPPTTFQRFLGWVTGRPPAPPAPLVLSSYPDGELAPSARSRAEQTEYSLETWGLSPRKRVISADDAFAHRAHRLGGLLREAK